MSRSLHILKEIGRLSLPLNAKLLEWRPRVSLAVKSLDLFSAIKNFSFPLVLAKCFLQFPKSISCRSTSLVMSISMRKCSATVRRPRSHRHRPIHPLAPLFKAVHVPMPSMSNTVISKPKPTFHQRRILTLTIESSHSSARPNIKSGSSSGLSRSKNNLRPSSLASVIAISGARSSAGLALALPRMARSLPLLPLPEAASLSNGFLGARLLRECSLGGSVPSSHRMPAVSQTRPPATAVALSTLLTPME